MTDPLFKLDPRHFPTLAAVANKHFKRLREVHHIHDLAEVEGWANAVKWLRENGEQFGAITEAIADAIQEEADEKAEDVRMLYLPEDQVN